MAAHKVVRAGQDADGSTQGGEGSTQGGEGSTQGESQDGETSHQRDRLTKLHRPTWVKELFFSLQTAQKLSLKETCDWVMEHMPSVFCPNGKPLMPSAVCTWKKQMIRPLKPLNLHRRSVAQSLVVNVVLYLSQRPTTPRSLIAYFAFWQG